MNIFSILKRISVASEDFALFAHNRNAVISHLASFYPTGFEFSASSGPAILPEMALAAATAGLDR